MTSSNRRACAGLITAACFLAMAATVAAVDSRTINERNTWVWAANTNGGIPLDAVQYADASSNSVLPVCTFYRVEDPSIYGPSFLHLSSGFAEHFTDSYPYQASGHPYCWYWSGISVLNAISASYCHDWVILGSPELHKSKLPDTTRVPVYPGVHTNLTMSRKRQNAACMTKEAPSDSLFTTITAECNAGADNGVPVDISTCKEFPQACPNVNFGDTSKTLLQKLQANGAFCEFTPDGGAITTTTSNGCWPWVLFDANFPVNVSFSGTQFVSAAEAVFTPNVGVGDLTLTQWVTSPSGTTSLERKVPAPGQLFQWFDSSTAAYKFAYVYPKYLFPSASTSPNGNTYTEDQLAAFLYNKDEYGAVYTAREPVIDIQGPIDYVTQRIFYADQRNVSDPFDQRCFGPAHYNYACNTTWTTSGRQQRGCNGYGRCPYTWDAATNTATPCSGHGRCSMTGVCVCNYPYIGTMCQYNFETDASLDDLSELAVPDALYTPINHGFQKEYMEEAMAIDICSGHGVVKYESMGNTYGYIYCECFPGWGGTTKHFKWDASGSGGDLFFDLNVFPTDLLLYATAVLSTPTSTVFQNSADWSGTGYTPAKQLFFQQCAIWIPRILGQEDEIVAKQWWAKYNYMTYDWGTRTTNRLATGLKQTMQGDQVYGGNQPTYMGIQEYAELQTLLSDARSSTGGSAVLPAFFRTPNDAWSADYDVLVTDPSRWGNRTGTCVFGWTGMACDIGCPACNATHSRCVAKNDTIRLVTQGSYWTGERTNGYAVCECDDNWGGSSCDVQVCPQAAHQDKVCGGPTRGVCVDKTVNETGITTIRKCRCFDGYHGYACELNSPCPYDSTFKGICSNAQPAVYENKTHAHGQCNNQTGVCECFPTPMDLSIVGYTGATCGTRACPSHNGQECSGAVQAEDPTKGVCQNRYDTSQIPKCDCVLTLTTATRNPGVNWGYQAGADQRWGIACENTYKDACWALGDKGNGLFCSGHGYACEPDDPTNPHSKPKCKCNSKWTGDYCENSNCPGGQHCIATALNSSAGACDDTGRCANGLCYEAPITGHAGTTLKCRCYGFDGQYFAGEACNDPAPECYAGDGIEGCHGPDHGECTRQGDGRYACQCKPWYNSAACATQTDCLSCNQTGQMCSDFNNGTFVCGCDTRYYQSITGGSNPQCLEVCNSTGGHPDPVTNACVCPPGSVWHDGCADIPAGHHCPASIFKGCRKLCPLYANKYECGLSSYALSIRQCNGGTPINASSSETVPNCTCDFLHTDPERMPDTTLHKFVQATNGSCEPWCVHGTPNQFSDVGQCGCYNTRFTGTRCNQVACSGNGRISNTSLTACVCDSPWAYTGATCGTDVCTATGGYYPGTWDHPVDHCACHLGSSGVQHRNASDHGAHLHQCVSLCDNGGVPDPATNLSTCTNCSAVYGGIFCDVSLCTHGSTPSSDGTSCVCDHNTWPQFGGTYCNVSLCNHGAPALTSGRGCNCTIVSKHLSGVLCNIDDCAQPPSYGHLNLSVSNTQCQCDIGYQSDPLDLYRCSRDVCNPGVAQVCTGGGCLHPVSMPGYNCNCGLHAARNTNGQCYVPTNSSDPGTVPCVNGVVLRNHSQGTTSCECHEGWAGLACNITACVLENQVYDPATDACACIFPFTGALCTEHTCGPHAAGAPICNQTIVNNTVVSERHCRCNCSVGFRPRHYAFPDNNTYPCVLDCEHPFSTLPLTPNATEAPTAFDAVGLVADNWYTDANISTSQCPCAGNFTGALCTGNPKYPERDQNTTKWINDLLEAHKEKWPVWKYVLVAMVSAVALAGGIYGTYKLVQECKNKHKYDYESVSTSDNSVSTKISSRASKPSRLGL